MKKEWWILVGIIIASVFGLFGQDLAYVMNDHVYKSYPIYYLRGFTIVSVVLYILTAVLADKLSKDKRSIYLSLIGLTGFFISCWSVFVLAMWGG